MENPRDVSPSMSEMERLIDENGNERKRLIDREWELRSELRSIMRPGMSGECLEEVRGRERASRADLSRNLDEYDVLVEKWAEEVSGIDPAPR